MFEESYHIKLGAFQGPLDLLLQLIERRKLHISDVSLSQVTDDFLAFIKKKENFPLGLSASFILIASTLLLIKSKSLLPALELTPEEETSIENLEARLREYQRIKELSIHVSRLFGSRIIWPRLPARRQIAVFSPDPLISIESALMAARRVIQGFPAKDARPEVRVRRVVSLEETIGKLSERVAKALKMSFSDFSGHGRGAPSQDQKVMIIVGFLAMLELAKQGAIAVTQEGLFDDIHMETETVGVPAYE